MKRLSLTRQARGAAGVLALAALCAVSFSPATPQAFAQDDTATPAIDFSYAGYGGGVAQLPEVAAVLSVRPSGGDDTASLQAALDTLASRTAGRGGFRGAVQLAAGKFRIAGQLRLRASGVVLRGSRNENHPTIIVATGTGRRTLIEIGGDAAPQAGAPVRVVGERAPAGSRTLTLERVEAFRAGDRVVVTRPCTAEWIAALGMNRAEGAFAEQRLHWLPGSRELVWDRIITAVDAEQRQITLDAPITTALERRFGGGTIAKVTAREPARQIGIEHLILESETDPANSRDEEHSWIAVALDQIEDAWVRRVVARRFAGSAVRVGRRARRVTVEDGRSEQPVSELGGYRRQSFFVEGQQTLVRRCVSEAGLNDFAVGFGAGGPNVFLDCTATGALGPSGAFESWASGVLYERVRIEGSGLRLTFDMTRAQGGGWTAANSVIWNSEAPQIEARSPADAPNLVRDSPESLYETQLTSRLRIANCGLRIRKQVVLQSAIRNPQSAIEASAIRNPQLKKGPLKIVNGRFVIDGRVVWGGMLNGAWWKGQVSPATAQQSGGVSITRFVPGRVGPGLTEDLPQLATRMLADGMPFYSGGHGLWYDRRRDDHTIGERADANVWSPFYEMPWARSGRGTAWDGLSRYDLTRFNPWYFARTREFARLCAQRGLVYYYNFYNTHNLLETTAHWVDFPWRPANNINNTGLPEPPPVEDRNTIHVANEFYSAEHPGRRALHRAYIRHTLAQLGDSPNVVLSLGFQFAGPLAFQQFFQDTVAEWERQTNRTVRLALITSKDITDAILADPARARQIAVIDMRYWQYRPNGALWAPPGGRNLAFREMITQEFNRAGDTPPPTTAEQVYRQVREYRDRFPDKAVVAWHSGVGPLPVLMDGGAQALMRNPAAGQSQGTETDRTHLDAFIREHLATVLMHMTPCDGVLADAARNWCLSDARGDTMLLYSLAGPSMTLAQTLPRRSFAGLWFDPRTGNTRPLGAPVSGAKGTTISKPTGEDWLLLLRARH